LFRTVVTFWISSTASKCDPLRWSFIVQKLKKSHGARSGDYVRFSSTMIDCFVKNSLKESAVYEDALLWWSIHLSGNSSGLTQRNCCLRCSKLWDGASGWQSELTGETLYALSLVVRESNQHCPDDLFWHPRFLGAERPWIFSSYALSLCLGIMLKNITFFPSDDSRSLFPLIHSETSTESSSSASLIVTEALWYHLGTNFLHPQVFNQNQSYNLSVDIYFLPNHCDIRHLSFSIDVITFPASSSGLWLLDLQVVCETRLSPILPKAVYIIHNHVLLT
jgi:hypothetical protein